MGSNIKINHMQFCCIKSEIESYNWNKLKCRIFNVLNNIQSGPSNVSYLTPLVVFNFCTTVISAGFCQKVKCHIHTYLYFRYHCTGGIYFRTSLSIDGPHCLYCMLYIRKKAPIALVMFVARCFPVLFAY